MRIQKLSLLAALAASVANAGWYSEFNTATTLDNHALASTWYLNYTGALSETTKWSAETTHVIGYRAEGPKDPENGVTTLVGKNDLTLSHTYLRFLYVNSKVAEFDGWTMELAYRWDTPTSTSAQQAGTFGAVRVRPGIKKSWGPVGLYARYAQVAYLVKNGYQMMDPTKANNWTGGVLEINPSYAFTDKLSLDVIVTYAYQVSAVSVPGKSRVNQVFGTEYDIVYQTPVQGLNVGLGLSHESATGNGAESIKFMTKKAEVALLVQKAF